MKDQTLGYAVFMQRPDGYQYKTDLVSAVFDNPVQADNALGFCIQKRFDPGVVYMLVELRQLDTRQPQPFGA